MTSPLLRYLSQHSTLSFTFGTMGNLIAFLDQIATHVKIVSVFLSFVLLLLTVVGKAMELYEKIQTKIEGEVEVEFDPEDDD